MARIQELEEANARLNEELAECRSYSSAVGHDILLPTVRELEAERAKTAGKRRWMDKSAQWVERLAPHIVEDAG